MTNNPETKSISNNPQRKFPIEALLLIVIILSASAIIALKVILDTPIRIFREGNKQIQNTTEKISSIFSSKQNFQSALGSIVSEQRTRKLQFFQRNQVCLFRIIRYIGKDKKEYNYTEFYKKESDKKPLSDLPILLNQYCEWQAKGVFEFNFYIDIENLSEWDYHWDKEHFKLTLYPPDITAGTPAELEPLVYTCIADSIGISKKIAKQELEKAISADLKQKLAEDQKKFLYEEARLAVKDLFIQFFRLHNIEKIPEIIVVFPHEKDKKERDRIIQQKL